MKDRYDKRIARHDSQKVYRNQRRTEYGRLKPDPWRDKGKNQFKKEIKRRV